MAKELIPQEVIETKIYLIRDQKVMLDLDISKLYGVDNRHLKRQVKRNLRRFPDDFMFVLNDPEINEMVRHFGTPFRSILGGSRPYAFTEHGILMLSSVLNNQRAIDVNVQIMRTFVRLRQILSTHKELRRKIEQMEHKYDGQFKVVFNAIRQLMAPPPEKTVKKIGFLKDKSS